jgi:hypothetical protein
MHDIDRALFEAEAEYEGAAEAELFERESGVERELALTNELLEVTGEQELDRFLGDLIRSAASATRDFVSSDAGRAVGGVLKAAARKALPSIGRMAGDALLPGRGGDLGARAGRWLGGQFEAEGQNESLSAEDREFEAARAFVRFAQETAEQAAASAGQLPPGVAARRAASAAARAHLPALLRPSTGPGPGAGGRASEGRWIRRGDRIVVLGA